MGFGTSVPEVDEHDLINFEYLMPDADVNFDIPESWLFEGWE